jgi:hypothetical protein
MGLAEAMATRCVLVPLVRLPSPGTHTCAESPGAMLLGGNVFAYADMVPLSGGGVAVLKAHKDTTAQARVRVLPCSSFSSAFWT